MPYLSSSIPSLPFQTGDTSHDAAEAMKPHATTQRERVFDFIKVSGAWGATDKDIAAALGIQRHSICPRRRELEAQGLIVKTERRRKECAVYTVVRP